MNPRRYAVKTTAAVALAIGAIAPASASARFELNPTYVSSPAKTSAAPAGASGSTFDWADAAVGAAVGVALSALGIGSGRVAVRRRRSPGAPAPSN